MDSVINFLFVDPTNTFLRAVFLSLISALIGWLLLARGKLRWSYPHQYSYSMPVEGEALPLVVKTRLIWVSNAGNAPLEAVEVVLNFRPQHYELWPPRPFDKVPMDNNREAIRLGTLAPRETVTLALLDRLRPPAS